MVQAVYDPRKYRQGDVLCKKGDPANEMFLTVSGKFLVTEFGIELPPGSPMGELCAEVGDGMKG
jgi:CRP-like cAMP-binding protein